MKRYLIALLGTLGTALAMVLTSNLLLGTRAFGSAEATREASRWQHETRGVTYAPPISAARPFKALRLADRATEVDAVVLGSSALMGITEKLLPWRTYNLTSTGNGTAAIAAEAEYLDRAHTTNINTLLIGLDWSVGMIYAPGDVPGIDMKPDAYTRAYTAAAVPWRKRIEDALSWPRVATLGQLVGAAVKSGAPMENLRRTLLDNGGAPYACVDGASARDFDVIHRGLCRGYRYDGSWTFAHDSRLSPAQAATLAAAAAAPSSKYTKHLCTHQGTPNMTVLNHLGVTARRFADRGGRVWFLLPPLSPGLEAAITTVAQWKTCLDNTKAALDEWARRHQVTVIDAGASERFGCVSWEFADEHHAYPECNAKVLERFFRDANAGRVVAGIYR